MAKELPQLEQSDLTHYIRPKGDYVKFENTEELLEKTREWGLNTKTSKKTEFWYKENFYKRKVEIDGYEIHGNYNTLVIKFIDGNLTCISPYYLKDMQSSSFGEETETSEELEEKVKTQKEKKPLSSESIPNEISKVTPKVKKETVKREKVEKEEKINLPEEKVSLTMTVKKFDTIYNSFAERDDVVVIYEQVHISNGDEKIDLDTIWSSMSKSLEKLELKEGDKIECEGKVVHKKFKKEVLYKLNNPSKIKVNL